MYLRKYKDFWPENIIEEKNKELLSALGRVIIYIIIVNLVIAPFSYNKYIEVQKEVENRRLLSQPKPIVIDSHEKKHIDKAIINKITKLIDELAVKNFAYADNNLTFSGNYADINKYLKYFSENKLKVVSVENQNNLLRIVVRMQ
ncbi:hypothetical protein [Clostridium manihotivorum]|uniref:Uncharacterized protein n=1 Tax=Clostridium manihotivorum TaxID=2320868 RepID=A0A3R5X1K3_9CLOT|nr:hypothetical protein [Clostridium manihotivorum]QAA32053.1 hypothetical protein C1I91_10520 [Clostridium manihotivorum]